jgi:hypothetical protein
MTAGEDSKRRSHLPTANALASSALASLFRYLEGGVHSAFPLASGMALVLSLREDL